MKDFIYNKLIKYFVLFSPIIDIITSYMYYHHFSVTIGLIIKGIVLVLSVIYLLFLDKEKRKRNFVYLLIITIFSIINIYNNLDVIKLEALSYFSYLFKFIYYLVMLLFFVRWYHEYNIKLSELRIPILIIAISTIISIFTNTAYISYQNNPYKEGFSMWYSSANELGNILCLLFPVCIYNAFHNKDGIRLDLYLVAVCGAALLILGTKVGLLGYFLIILSYLVLRLIFIKVIKFDMRFVFMLAIFLLPLMFYKYLPGVFNINVSIRNVNNSAILSGRENALERIGAERKEENLLVKIFGKSYYGEQKNKKQIMLAEQDFVDIFFMYGYVGILLTIIPILYLGIKVIHNFLKEFKTKKKVSKKTLAIAFSVCLLLMVAFISGHAILTPSVSLYLVLLMALLSNLEFTNKKSKKKRILMSNNESTKKISMKYEVDVIEENKLCKNRFITYLTIRNQNYDYIVESKKDSIYMMTYLKYSNGVHIDYKEVR